MVNKNDTIKEFLAERHKAIDAGVRKWAYEQCAYEDKDEEECSEKGECQNRMVIDHCWKLILEGN